MKTNLELISSINLKGLELLVSEKVGFPIKFEASVNLRNGTEDDYYLALSSQELKQFSGIMSNIYETLKLTNFEGSIQSNGLVYWLPIHYSFTYFSGGSNGATLGTFLYEFETQSWVFYK